MLAVNSLRHPHFEGLFNVGICDILLNMNIALTLAPAVVLIFILYSYGFYTASESLASLATLFIGTAAYFLGLMLVNRFRDKK